jgi:MHS family proline/betaine transporter-like MFS transporter
MQFMQLQFALSTIAVITLVSAGFFADKLSPIKIMRTASVLLVLLAWPLGMLLDSSNLYFVLGAEIALVVINEILLGPSNAYLKQIFPVDCRYRGVAFSFCLGMAIFGGLTPVVENYLYQTTGYLQSVALWLIFVSGLTCLAFSLVKPLQQSKIP